MSEVVTNLWGKKMNIVSHTLTVNWKKISSIHPVLHRVSWVIFLCQPGLSFHLGTSTLLSSCLHLWVSHLLSCTLYISSHISIAQEASSLRASHCIRQLVWWEAAPRTAWPGWESQGQAEPQCHLCALCVARCIYLYVYDVYIYIYMMYIPIYLCVCV